MSRKGENVYKRKDGRWEARYVKSRDSSGKIRYGFCYGRTYREAKEKVFRTQAALLNGQSTAGGRVSRNHLSFYCREWLAVQKSRVKESSFIKYETILSHHIEPRLGSRCPQAITTKMVEAFKQELLLEEELSPKTVKDILIVLRSVVKYAARHYPGLFPEMEIQYPKDIRKEKRVLTLEEQRQLAAYLQHDMDTCKFGILLAMQTGIRIGELCALRWEHISLREKVIRIDSTMQRLRDTTGTEGKKTRVAIGSPKSSASVRTIPMSETTAVLCSLMQPQDPSAFVLTGSMQYMEPRTLQYRFKHYSEECGLDDVHFHTLRHTFATRCVEVGFELKSLSEILGHANTSVTLGQYVHSSLDLKRDNMNKLVSAGL